MAQPLLSIGNFIFSIPTLLHDELQRQTDWRHAANARIGAPDATQFIGPGQDTVSISGTALAELSDGAASLDQLRAMAATGEPQPMVDGSGWIRGDFIINRIDERRKHLLADGTALKIDFGIDLTRVEKPRS